MSKPDEENRLRTELVAAQRELNKWRNWKPDNATLADAKEQAGDLRSAVATKVYIAVLESRYRELTDQLAAALAEAEKWRITSDAHCVVVNDYMDETAELKAEIAHDAIAYRGQLGYAVPSTHDGKLSDGTAPPENVLAAHLQAEIERLKRGEFICSKCGLRKDGEHDGPVEF